MNDINPKYPKSVKVDVKFTKSISFEDFSQRNICIYSILNEMVIDCPSGTFSDAFKGTWKLPVSIP